MMNVWIFLGIVAFIAALITAILLSPFTFIIRTDKDGELQLLYKILFKTFGENPNPNQPIVKALKSISGVSRLEKGNLKKSTENGELLTTLRDDLSLIIGILKELLSVLKRCTLKTLHIDVVCGGEDAADVAMNYGVCYAVISPLVNLVHNTMKVRSRGERINITTDFDSQEGSFRFEAILVTSVFRIVAALFKLAFDEAKRLAEEEPTSVKPRTQK